MQKTFIVKGHSYQITCTGNMIKMVFDYTEDAIILFYKLHQFMFYFIIYHTVFSFPLQFNGFIITE